MIIILKNHLKTPFLSRLNLLSKSAMSWSIIIYDVTNPDLDLFYLRAAQDWSEVMAFRKSPSEVSIKASTASGSIESDS